MTDVLTFGESLGSLRGTGPLRLGGTMRLTIAGAESNVAIGLSRLGHRVRWVGMVGPTRSARSSFVPCVPRTSTPPTATPTRRRRPG